MPKTIKPPNVKPQPGSKPKPATKPKPASKPNPATKPKPSKYKLAEISEKEFQSQVIELARKCGYLIYHTYDSRRCVSGFPDLILVHPARVDCGIIVAELKRETATATKEQVEWLTAFGRSGCGKVYLWRPSDLPVIAEILVNHGLKKT